VGSTDPSSLRERLLAAWREELYSEETVVEVLSVALALPLALGLAWAWRPAATYALFPAGVGPGLAAYELRRRASTLDRGTAVRLGLAGPFAGTAAFAGSLVAIEATGVGTEAAAVVGGLVSLLAVVVGGRILVR
jgi:hypothetical protein